MRWYWLRLQHTGIPVRFPAFRFAPRRYLWRGIYGIQIGHWFFGAINGSPSPRPQPIRDEQER